MSEPKFTPGPWRVFNETEVGTGKVWVTDCEDIEVGFGRREDKYNAALIAAAPEMYESNALCLDETCVMQVAFTFACAKCEISKDTKCEDCPISAGMRAMFRQRDRIAKLQKEARGER